MTYPGLTYQIGPPPQTAVGQQVRQSRAGMWPSATQARGGKWVTALDAMGSNAPAAGVVAERRTVAQEMLKFPYAIERQDFELGTAFGGLDEGGLDIAISPTTVLSASGYFNVTFPFEFGATKPDNFTLQFPFTFNAPYILV